MILNYWYTFLQSLNKNKHVFDNILITEASASNQCRIKIHSFKPHFSKIEECLKEEEEKTEVIAVKTKLNEEVCVRCCQKFGIIFNRKQLCLVCKHYVCKRCADYNDSEKGYTCHACIKERSGNYLINNWCRKYLRDINIHAFNIQFQCMSYQRLLQFTCIEISSCNYFSN